MNDTTDLCEFLGGKNKNLIVKWVMEMIQASLPAVDLHPCPYYPGVLKWNNVTLDLSKIPSFPDGEYRVKIVFFNSDDDNIMSNIYLIELRDKEVKNF
ncbi:hypothetical protein PVAND_012774 [Polypedilum vanderplanki]|uniref:Uncharacterized protein n=1 Tax=Polypedilum vanderplanki TaxID=319348 RepID=A0A9J6CPE7_POLVA|nr:hypothetical protein PVAND_012774 [Polypedilum vanderplanki]